MEHHQNIALPSEMINEIDKKRGLIKRATYVQGMIYTAWKNKLEIAPPAAAKLGEGVASTPSNEVSA